MKTNRGKFLFIGLLVICGNSLFAMKAYQGQPKSPTFLQTGRFFGGNTDGQAKNRFSLVNIRQSQSLKHFHERIVLDLADSDGQPLINQLGYYHVAIETVTLHRISIDLQQMKKPNLTAQSLNRVLQGSLFVKASQIFYDEIEQSINLTYQLTGPAEVSIFELVSKDSTSRIVFDFRRPRE